MWGFMHRRPPKESARADAPAERMDPQEVSSVESPSTVPDPFEVAEMADNGRSSEAAMWRSIQAIGTDVLRIEDAPVTECSLTHGDASAAGSELLTARDHIHEAALRVPLEGGCNPEVHRHLNNAVNELDLAGVELANGWPLS
jgi:hypothetical protein